MNFNCRRRRLLQRPYFLQNSDDGGFVLHAKPRFVGLDAHVDDVGRGVFLHGKQLDVILVPRRWRKVEDFFQLAQRLADKARQALVGALVYRLSAVA